MDVASVLEHIGGRDFEGAIRREAGNVLVACLGGGLDRSEQEDCLREIAKVYEGRLKIWVLEEQERDVFHVQHQIIGTPTYLLFKKGAEQDRMLGKVTSESLTEFASRTMD